METNEIVLATTCLSQESKVNNYFMWNKHFVIVLLNNVTGFFHLSPIKDTIRLKKKPIKAHCLEI